MLGFTTNTDDNRFAMLDIMIKIGEVSSVDAAKCTARVVFDDDDSLVSYDLPILQRNTLKNHDYALPDVGEDVICLFLASGSEAGFILGSIYAGEIEPPENAANKRYIEFSDGTKLSYDRSSHKLAAAIGDTTIEATQDSAKVTAGGVTFTLSGNKATVDAQNIELGGNTTISGTLDVSGNTSVGGTLGVTGNTSVGGMLGVTGAATAANFTAGATSLITHVHPFVGVPVATPGTTSPGQG